MTDDIKSKIPMSFNLLALFLFLFVYKKLTKINTPITAAKIKIIGNMNTRRIPIAMAIPVHLSSRLADFLLSLYL
jgi:hypothetical protein